MKKIFDNTQVAFSLKSDIELHRAYFLFKLISNKLLVRIGTLLLNFALKINLPVESLIRSTVFNHFCGGISENDCISVVEKMFANGVFSVLDYSIEGKEEEEQFDSVLNKTIALIYFAKNKKAMPFVVFKPSGFGRINLFQIIGEGKQLTFLENEEWKRVVVRFEMVCKASYDNDIRLLIDAEESWIQDAIDNLVEEMMLKYNKIKPIVFNTFQMYRWDRLEYLKKLHQNAKVKDFQIGVKLVRGAYMEKENHRAQNMGYVTPICLSKDETDINFDKAIQYIIDNISIMSIYLGTHNESSNYFLLKLMKEKGFKNNDVRIWFGQLYGMSDNITYNLAENGYNVTKYLPFGPVKDVMPYLIRRAEENTSVAGQTNRELLLINTERKRRKVN